MAVKPYYRMYCPSRLGWRAQQQRDDDDCPSSIQQQTKNTERFRTCSL